MRYGDQEHVCSAAEAIESAKKARSAGADVVFILGDLNEPSHRDWTEEAAAAGIHPMAMEWPTVRALEGMGFVDSYRELYPDSVTYPAPTTRAVVRMGEGACASLKSIGAGTNLSWLESLRNPPQHPDRIDYVLYRANPEKCEVELVVSLVVGMSNATADITIDDYPSDHRTVVTTMQAKRLNSNRQNMAAPGPELGSLGLP